MNDAIAKTLDQYLKGLLTWEELAEIFKAQGIQENEISGLLRLRAEELRDKDLEALVHQVLRADGKVFPASEKDISNLESEIDTDEVKPIDPARLLVQVNDLQHGEMKP